MTHNTTTTTIAATFAEFLAHPEISGEIENLYLSLGDSGIQFPADAEDLIYAVGSSGSADADLLYSVEELADKFLNAASEMRGFIAGYLEQRGAIKPAIEVTFRAETPSLLLVSLFATLHVRKERGAFNACMFPKPQYQNSQLFFCLIGKLSWAAHRTQELHNQFYSP